MIKLDTVLIIIACLIAISAGVLVQSLSTKDPAAASIPTVEFSLPDTEGKIHQLSDWQGKIRIVNFWATWCPPCLKEIPEFIKLQQQYKDKNVQFIGIAIEDQQAVNSYLKINPTNYPMLIGGDQAIKLAQKWGNIINAVPFSVIINQQGQLIHLQPGELSREKILQIITPIL